MRILLANEGPDDAGGVNTYLRAIVPSLRARGHDLAFLHDTACPTGSAPPVEPSYAVREMGFRAALSEVARWQPDVCYSHNMHALAIDDALMQRWPVVKMMHGYFGTCISGHKAHAWPARAVCHKPFGTACLAHFFPRRCGEAAPIKMWRQYGWARRQRALFERYARIVVASEHMRREYLDAGLAGAHLHTLPLFAPELAAPRPNAPAGDHVVFLGRMTPLKGGDVLIDAVARASRALGRPVALTMAGVGPMRRPWIERARRAGVSGEFPGWIDSTARTRLLSTASVLAVPSTWPEPFGLVGLEAAACGVPAVAFDVGGIREWLRDDESGLLAGADLLAPGLGDVLARVLADTQVRRRLAEGALNVARTMTLAAHVDALVGQVLEPAARNARAGVGTT